MLTSLHVPVLLFVLTVSIVSCRTNSLNDSASLGIEPVTQTSVNSNFRSGTTFEMPLDSARDIDQITVSWDVKYNIALVDASGKPALNDEGKPMFKDGMYAYGKVLDSKNVLRDVGPKKFVDSGETDNWHDISGIRGRKLIIEFWHSRDFSADPQVMGAGRTILLKSVSIRYKDQPGEVYKDFVFNPNPNDEMSSQAKAIGAGGTFTLSISASLKVYRVDVRWGDAKPRVNGVYVPGRASGRLKWDGVWQGEARNVAAIETQTWTNLTFPSPNGANHTLNVSFQNDQARVHSVRVYYRP